MVPDRDKTSKLDPVEKTKQKKQAVIHSQMRQQNKKNKETTVMGQFQLESEVLKGSHNSQSGSEIPRVTVPLKRRALTGRLVSLLLGNFENMSEITSLLSSQ